jgi:hypothetical protein
MLRGFVTGFGVLLLGASFVGLRCGAGPGMIGPMILGFLVIAGTIFERGRYRPAESPPPGPGWEATGEKFLDPASGGKPVEVWYNKTTGERRYVQS